MSIAATTNPLRKDQADTIFRVTIKDDDDSVVDVSSANAKTVEFKNPDGTTSSETASFTTDGTDGKIEYKDTGAAKTDVVGTWTYWGKVTLSSGDGPFPSSPLTYLVKAEGA